MLSRDSPRGLCLGLAYRLVEVIPNRLTHMHGPAFLPLPIGIRIQVCETTVFVNVVREIDMRYE